MRAYKQAVAVTDNLVDLETDQIVGGRKTFPDRMAVVDLAVNSISPYENIDIELSAIPYYTATAFLRTFSDESLINKGYVDELDDENVKLEGNQSIKGNKTFSDNATVFGDAYLFGDLVWIRNSTAKLQIDSTGNFAPSSGIREPVLLSFQHNGHDIFTVNTEASLTTLSKFYSDNDDPANATIQMVFDDEGSTTLGDGCVRFTSDVQGKSTGRPREEKSFVSAKFVDDTFLALDGGTITGDLTVQGDAYVAGQFNVVSSNDVNIGDRIITLNSEIEDTAAPSLDAGIEIARGTQDNAQLLFDESTDQWVAGIVGALKALATEGYVDDNFLSLDGGTLTGDLNIDKSNPYLTIDATDSPITAPHIQLQRANVNTFQIHGYSSTTQFQRKDSSGTTSNTINIYDTYTDFSKEVRGPDPADDAAYTPKSYVEEHFLSLDGGTVAGQLNVKRPSGQTTLRIDSDTLPALQFSINDAEKAIIFAESSRLRLRYENGSADTYLNMYADYISVNKELRGPDPVDNAAYTPKKYVEDNFVTIDTTQNIDGAKTFTKGLTVEEPDGISSVNVKALGVSDSSYLDYYINNKRSALIFRTGAGTGATDVGTLRIRRYNTIDNTVSSELVFGGSSISSNNSFNVNGDLTVTDADPVIKIDTTDTTKASRLEMRVNDALRGTIFTEASGTQRTFIEKRGGSVVQNQIILDNDLTSFSTDLNVAGNLDVDGDITTTGGSLVVADATNEQLTINASSNGNAAMLFKRSGIDYGEIRNFGTRAEYVYSGGATDTKLTQYESYSEFNKELRVNNGDIQLINTGVATRMRLFSDVGETALIEMYSGGVEKASWNTFETSTAIGFEGGAFMTLRASYGDFSREMRGVSTSSNSNSKSLVTKDYIDDVYTPADTSDGAGVTLREATPNGNNIIILRAPDSVTASYNIIFPETIGNVGDVLTCVGKGPTTMIMAWQAP